jgi:hypothetical protein
MKVTILLLVLVNTSFGQTANLTEMPSKRLKVEIQTSLNRVHITDEVVVTVFFRSPDREVTIWNALGWGVPTGLSLRVFDSSGHEVHTKFAPFYHPIPPDLTGKAALITIGGRTFAGFDSRVPVELPFPKPGEYTIKCLYEPPLSRHYFQGQTIWGTEDGPSESASAPVVVEG